MDLKDLIKSYTKIDKTQRVKNVKWSPVPKNTNQTPWYSNQSIPSFLEFDHAKSLHDSSQREEYESRNDEEEEFQFLEIREKLREAGTGWDVQKGVTKRYRDSQIKYAKVAANTSSESNTSFTTARTTTTSLTEDSFSSALQDFQNLEISEKKEEKSTKSEVLNCSSVDKVRYKRNALITGIIYLREKNCLVAENASVCLTPDKLTEKENLPKDKRKAGRYENQTRKFQSKKKTAKSRQPLKDLVQKKSKKKDNSIQKKVGGTDVDRDYFMNLPDERFTEFVTKKSKNARKVLA